MGMGWVTLPGTSIRYSWRRISTKAWPVPTYQVWVLLEKHAKCPWLHPVHHFRHETLEHLRFYRKKVLKHSMSSAVRGWFSVQYKELHCVALHCVALHCVALHCVALHCVALRCVALRCVALCYTAMHCATLHCVVILETTAVPVFLR